LVAPMGVDLATWAHDSCPMQDHVQPSKVIEPTRSPANDPM
jgi:hypothetical protein